MLFGVAFGTLCVSFVDLATTDLKLDVFHLTNRSPAVLQRILPSVFRLILGIFREMVKEDIKIITRKNNQIGLQFHMEVDEKLLNNWYENDQDLSSKNWKEDQRLFHKIEPELERRLEKLVKGLFSSQD